MGSDATGTKKHSVAVLVSAVGYSVEDGNPLDGNLLESSSGSKL